MKAFLLAVALFGLACGKLCADDGLYIIFTVRTVWADGTVREVGDSSRVRAATAEGFVISDGANPFVVPTAHARPATEEEAFAALDVMRERVAIAQREAAKRAAAQRAPAEQGALSPQPVASDFQFVSAKFGVPAERRGGRDQFSSVTTKLYYLLAPYEISSAKPLDLRVTAAMFGVRSRLGDMQGTIDVPQAGAFSTGIRLKGVAPYMLVIRYRIKGVEKTVAASEGETLTLP